MKLVGTCLLLFCVIVLLPHSRSFAGEIDAVEVSIFLAKSEPGQIKGNEEVKIEVLYGGKVIGEQFVGKNEPWVWFKTPMDFDVDQHLKMLDQRKREANKKREEAVNQVRQQLPIPTLFEFLRKLPINARPIVQILQANRLIEATSLEEAQFVRRFVIVLRRPIPEWDTDHAAIRISSQANRGWRFHVAVIGSLVDPARPRTKEVTTKSVTDPDGKLIKKSTKDVYKSVIAATDPNVTNKTVLTETWTGPQGTGQKSRTVRQRYEKHGVLEINDRVTNYSDGREVGRETKRVEKFLLLRITGSPTGGTWTVSYDSETTIPLQRDVSAEKLKDAIGGLAGFPATVKVDGPNGGPFLIEPNGPHDVNLFKADTSGLTGGTNPQALFIATKTTLEDSYEGIEKVFHRTTVESTQGGNTTKSILESSKQSWLRVELLVKTEIVSMGGKKKFQIPGVKPDPENPTRPQMNDNVHTWRFDKID